MNFKQLSYFQVIAELASVTRAAQQLRIAQPALTRHMKNLESHLGVTIFAKSGRGITLTPAGQDFLDHATRILDDIRRAEIAMDAHRAERPQMVKLGLPSSLGALIASGVIDAAERVRPVIGLTVIDGWSRFILDWLMSEQLDIGIVYDNTVTDPMIELEPIACEPHYLVGRRDLMDAARGVVTLAELAQLPLVLPSQQHGLRRTIDTCLSRQGLSVTPIMELDAAPTIKALLERERAYSILSQSDAEWTLSPNMLAVPIEDPPLLRRLYVARRRDTRKVRAVATMVELIRSEAAMLIAQGRWGRPTSERVIGLGE